MTLDEFARKCGVVIFDGCGPEWGGPYGYYMREYPNSRVQGYKTREILLKGWMQDTFGRDPAKVIMTLLEVKHDR